MTNHNLLREGFSLIELMIVIAILGIVAALAIPAYNNYIIRARISNMITAADVVKQAVSEDRQFNGNFNNVVPTDAQTTFTNLGITDPTLLSNTISAVEFTVADEAHMSVVVCGATLGQGTPTDADTVDIYFIGTYYDSGMRWGCEYEGNSVYVPTSCRIIYQPDIFGTLSGACPRVAPTPPY